MSRTSYADLEIGLQRPLGGSEGGQHRPTDSTYQVELRFSDPKSEAELPTARGPAAFDFEQLLTLHLDPDAYGKALASALFADDGVARLYGKVRAAVESSGRHLRLRLVVGASAGELHDLRWELLRDPENDAPLATSERVLFSRFLESDDWRRVRLRSKASLKALVAVAAPTNLGKYKLADIDVDGEIQRAETSLAGIAVEALGREQPLTLNRLVDGLRKGHGEGVDVLYLVCHGVLTKKGVPCLLLQDDTGEVERFAGADLAERLAELPQPPRLAVLASCESAGREDADVASSEGGKATAQASLAPRLAAAGVSAVLAMQGQISMTTVELAMPIFFKELLKDGRIDGAMAVARRAVLERHDHWMPALYLRLKRGLWYEPGFAGEGDTLKKWASIARNVADGKFVPILGPDLCEHLYGSVRGRARSLASAHGFPMQLHQRFDLAKVCQYLAVSQSRDFVRSVVAKTLKTGVRERFPELAQEKRLLSAVAGKAVDDPDDPLRILADLDAEVYVTAASDLVLARVLGSATRQDPKPKRKPKPLFSKWRRTRDNHPQEPPYDGKPSQDEPIVFHAFGVDKKDAADSLVLTEDDFLDYLIAAADYKLIPTAVRGKLVKSSLLFLGFPLDDLAFRVLFRLILSLEGSSALGDLAHVGVQVDPEEHSLADIERARDFLAGYFQNGTGGEATIDVYWGTAADFLKELRMQVAAVGSPAAEEDEEEAWDFEDD